MEDVKADGAQEYSVEDLRQSLFTSSTNRRVAELRSINEKLVRKEISSEAQVTILQSIIKTYAFYTDRASRHAVHECLSTFFSLSEADSHLTVFVPFLDEESLRGTLAPGSIFVLIEWCSVLELCLADNHELWNKWGLNVFAAQARLLEKCAASSTKPHDNKTLSALVVTRRALRAIFKNDLIGQKAANDTITAMATKGAVPTATNAVMLGVIAGVCARIPAMKSVVAERELDFYGFYVREILGSRTVLPQHIANGLHDFFESFATEESILTHAAPAIEKALLRAPEVVLNDLISPLIKSLPVAVDVSEFLEKHLLKGLVANVKSTNVTIRDGAKSTFESAAKHSENEKSLLKVAEELLKQLKDAKSADQRLIYAQMLAIIRPSSALTPKVLTGLAPLVMKETNETALVAEIEAIGVQMIYSFVHGTALDAAIMKAFVQGLADKKPSIRRAWAVRLGEIVWSLNPEHIEQKAASEFLEATLAKLTPSFDEVVANAVPTAQTGLVTVAYVLTAISFSTIKSTTNPKLSDFVKKAGINKAILGSDTKPSFLTNHRVYSKLTNVEDLIWSVRAIAAAAKPLIEAEAASSDSASWSHAFFYLLTAASVQPAVKKEAKRALTSVYIKNPGLTSQVVIKGLWQWLRNVDLDEKDTPAAASKTGRNDLHLVVNAICVSKDSPQRILITDAVSVLSKQLQQLLVLCRQPLIARLNWITLCLNTGLDPKSIVEQNPDEWMEEVTQRSHTANEVNAHSSAVHRAACDAAAELAFVAPETIIPRLVNSISDDLEPTQLVSIGPTEVAIYRTPDGTAFVDVLSTKKEVAPPSKNTKDYDTLKWEQELRAQLAAKQGQQKKLTPEEQAKVKAQLAKEAVTRHEVAIVETKLRRGIGMVKSLAEGPPTDVEAWFGPAVNSLVQAIHNGAGILVGDAAVNAYLSCAERTSPRLGLLRKFIGVATLRAQGTSQIAKSLEQEPLGDLVTRILYRLRFSSEQRAFEPVSLLYILPLINLILTEGGAGKLASEEIDEQIQLALEFLSFHVDQFSSTRLPREDISSILIASMQRYTQHYKLLKDCLLNICHAFAPSASDAEVSVFLRAAILPDLAVRTSALQAIDADLDLPDNTFCAEIWLACHEDDEENAELASTIWEENSLTTTSDSGALLIPYLESQDRQLRRAASRALTACVKQQEETLPDVITLLQTLYNEKAKTKAPERDAYGMPRKVDLTDPWEARHGIALAFKELSAVFDPNKLVDFVRFLVERGPVADKNAAVRDAMVDAATTLISLRGASKVEELMQIFEDALEAPNSGAKDHDLVNEAVIIMYGALARHLKAGDERIPKVVLRLLTTLSTPSETVQYAVAGCLPPLVQSSSAHVSEYLQHVMAELLQAKKYASRRGAAYGLAGLVRGKGISALREFRIMSSLKSAVEEKKDSNQRQGAFLAFELLSLILGPIFEPYVIQIVPQLLAGFGDSSADVREACLDAAKTCFASLSSFGVKQVLPVLLGGLDDPQWRSKKGACDSLGAMAYLDPQQLSTSLPEIIPPLTDVLNDSHKEVRSSANRSLQRFGDVLTNPEIKSNVNILLKALSDPTKYTDDALDSLLKVSFTHYLDAPSLALVVRILERGLGDRSATKRKAAQIIGSLAHLTERRDLVSHLPILVSGLRVGAVDPVPTTRATASKALGSLVEKLGEDALPDLIPSLMATLKTDTGAGDRLGSAQALSEVLAGLGIGRLEETLPSILQNVASTKAAVREGFMSLFIFLPACFGSSFANYLSKIIPPILAGLADDVESIRDTALRAGRLLVKNFATRAIDLLLPELQRGLADDSHRIRLSSVELVGDLLFNLTGVTAKADTDDAEEGATAAGQNLLEVLGEERRNNILSALYVSRCDTSGLVRTAAVNVWKALVATPRTLREITPTLTQVIIRRLASSNPEQKVIAGNALGELIRKAGEGVMASLLPTLEEGLQTSVDVDERQGICIALRELIQSAPPDTLADFEPKLVSVVRVALVDSDEDVREAAAEAFDSMQKMFGKKVIDQVLPNLLGLLRDEEEANNALAALLTLLTEATRSNIILPNLLPSLLASPISAFNARALASLASVAGSAMTKRLSNILNSLMDNIVTCKEEDRLQDLEAAFDAVLQSVDEFDGLNTAMSVMLALVKHDDHRKRRSADLHLANFFVAADVDYSRYYADLIRALLHSFDDRDPEVVKAAWTALSALTNHLRKEDMESLVISTRQVLGQVGVAGHNLPGFSLPKGINAILPIFLQGLINGTPEQRTQAALAINEIIDKTSGDSLKPFVTQITGPLIRVVSERSVEVKAAILLTLNHLLEKIPTFLKPFLPQLQRTFTKALADTSSEVLRTRAAKALGTLIVLTPRIDPLIGELVTGSKTDDQGVKSAMQKALFEVISKVGANMNEGSRASIVGLIDEDAADADDATMITNARLLGALIKNLAPDVAGSLVKSRVLSSHFTRSSVLALNSILLDSPSTLTEHFGGETISTICRGIGSNDRFVADNCILAAGKYFLTESSNKSFDVTKPILEAFIPALQPGTPLDSRRLALVVIRTISRENSDIIRPHLALLAPAIFANVRDLVIPIKLAAEAAFLSVFCVVDDESAVFDKYLAGPGAALPPTTKRSIQDYFKRVALRLGLQARERREAEGGQGGLGLSNDEKDDEREIWSVGKIDLGEVSFED